ncbi:MAG TPA: glutamyl-tRNA reductase [Terriglobales bacterium]|nr:glutamyl-tRNA reductase [Terriglobales bacterium]
MNYSLLGVNHHTAPVEVRERLAISESRLPDAMRILVQTPGISEAIIFSTCNRVEILARAPKHPPDLRPFVEDFFNVRNAELAPYLYEHRNKDAVRHLFRVASSLDSMVVGESQILGQVKESYAIARTVGSVHSHLDQLMTRAFAVAKRVRTETSIGSSAVSVATVAVELAKKIFGSLEGKNVYLVGAGKMSELAARHLMAHGAGTIFVANRTHDRAVELARRFHGKAMLFEGLYETAAEADIIISSTGSPVPIFRREHGELFLHRRKNKPMFFIDIAVPRDVDAEMNRVDGIFVYDIDDLQSVIGGNLEHRHAEAARAESIIEAEVERFEERISTREVVPMIVSLQSHLENIRQAEIDKVRSRLGKLSAEQELAIDAMTKGIMNKVLHTPITALKEAARDSRGEKGKSSDAGTLIELVRRIFNLQRAAEQDQPQDEKTSVQR